MDEGTDVFLYANASIACKLKAAVCIKGISQWSPAMKGLLPQPVVLSLRRAEATVSSGSITLVRIDADKYSDADVVCNSFGQDTVVLRLPDYEFATKPDLHLVFDGPVDRDSFVQWFRGAVAHAAEAQNRGRKRVRSAKPKATAKA